MRVAVLDTGEELEVCPAFTDLTPDELDYMRTQPEYGLHETARVECDRAVGHPGPHVSIIHGAHGGGAWWLLWSCSQRSIEARPGCDYDEPQRGADWFCHLHLGHDGPHVLYPPD